MFDQVISIECTINTILLPQRAHKCVKGAQCTTSHSEKGTTNCTTSCQITFNLCTTFCLMWSLREISMHSNIMKKPAERAIHEQNSRWCTQWFPSSISDTGHDYNLNLSVKWRRISLHSSDHRGGPIFLQTVANASPNTSWWCFNNIAALQGWNSRHGQEIHLFFI